MQSLDYIDWANHHLYLDFPEINKLASMKEPFNVAAIEEIFEDILKVLQQKTPTKEQCVNDHLKRLHAQILVSTNNATSILEEIFSCIRKHDLFDEIRKWQEISDTIDHIKTENHQLSYKKEQINTRIVAHARKLWHTKGSAISCKELIGQKVIAVDSEVHFILQLEKGAIVIECPWRIRDTGCILLGETDIQTNQEEWKTVGELLIGKTIEDICIMEQCPLLIIQLGELFLDVFHASSFFDGWTLTDEEEFYLFSMHGGHFA